MTDWSDSDFPLHVCTLTMSANCVGHIQKLSQPILVSVIVTATSVSNALIKRVSYVYPTPTIAPRMSVFSNQNYEYIFIH